jgi:Zn-dependent alcohol dehydrogenase
MKQSIKTPTYKLIGKFFQIIKRITGGGADYSFECIGDTGMMTTALQSCCDVMLSISPLVMLI